MLSVRIMTYQRVLDNEVRLWLSVRIMTYQRALDNEVRL
jgi:hypothetical protein